MAQHSYLLDVEERKLSRDVTGQDTFYTPELDDRNPVLVGHQVYIPCYASVFNAGVPAMVFVNLNTDSWRCDKTSGPSRARGKCFLFKDMICFMGSAMGFDSLGEMKLSFYDIIMEEWSACSTTGSPPRGRNGFSGEYVEEWNQFIVFGGKSRNSPLLNDVHLLDLDRRRWIQPDVSGEVPRGRAYHGSCVRHGKMFVYGGLGSTDHSDCMYILQVSSRDKVVWSKPKVTFSSATPFHLNSFALVPFQGGLLLCGGKGRSISAHKGLRMYDPLTGDLVELRSETRLGFSGYGLGVSAILLEEGQVAGVFKSGRQLRSYIRISRQS